MRSFLKDLGYPVKEPDWAEETLYAVVWVASQAQRRAAKVLKAFGLSPVKMNYLMIVKHVGSEEGITQREIAKRLLIDAGNVTHVLDDLERKGWVIRASGPDRRSNRIRVTAKGSRVLDEAWPAYKKMIQSLTQGLSSGAQHSLVRVLSRWRDVLSP